LRLKLLLKRGALLAAANWPAIAIQFAAQTTFQLLLAIPIVGAAILVALLRGADLTNLLQGGTRDMFTRIADALTAEPFALGAFVVAFGIVLLGGSALMFLVKGGTVEVMLASDAAAAAIERDPISIPALRQASAFSIERFVAGCQRLFRRYLGLGVALMVVYALSGVAYLTFLVYGFRTAGERYVLTWTAVAAISAIGVVLWITAVNLVYLLMQIVTAVEDRTLREAFGEAARFVRAEILELGGVFLVVFAMVVAATVASTLGLSAVAVISYVPFVGPLVVLLQIAALIVRGLVFEYIGLLAMGSYVTLYRRYAGARVTSRAASPAALLSSAPRP
jgi:hypothetical protein